VGILLSGAAWSWARVTAVVTIAILLPATTVHSDTDAPPFPGAFAATSHRSFADVDHWKSVFDDPARDEWQHPEQVIETLALARDGMVADLGAGTGYFTFRLAHALGQRATVFAVETEPNLVVYLRDRADRNVVPILASEDDARLPANIIDVILVVDTYHHIDRRLEYFQRLKSKLSSGGRIAIIDWKKEATAVGPELGHRIARGQVVYEMSAAGYRLTTEPTFLPYHYFLIFVAS
jgi:SAM-dependent methyltransferase